MTDKIKKHKWVIMLAFAIGVISVAPQLYFAFFNSDFSGIHMFGTDAEHHYLARIQEVRDGYASLGNVFLPNKDQPYLMMGGGEVIAAILGKILFLDTVEFNLLSKFVFPFVIFLLIYFFVYKIFASRSIAIITASMAFFGSDLTSGPSAIMELFQFKSSAIGFLAHTRPINPQISAIFLFTCLYLLFKILYDTKGISLKLPILFGVISGLAVYIYIYVWSFLAIVIALYFFYFLYEKNKGYIKKFLYIIFIHSFVTIPYWINFFQARSHPDYIDSAMRQGLVSSHEFVLGMWLVISLIAVLFFWPDEYRRAKKFLLFVVIALWIATNQQIISGIMVQQAHYHWNITKPVLVSIIVSALFVYSMRRFVKIKKIITLAVILSVLVLFYHGVLSQISAYEYLYPRYLEYQKYSDVVLYFSENYASEQNIFSTHVASVFLSVYTKHNAPNNPFSVYYLNSREYFSKLLFLEYKLIGIEPEVAGDIMRTSKCAVVKRVFGIYYREQYGDCNALPDEIIDGLESSYKSFYNLSYADIFEDLRIDFVVWDKISIPGLRQVHNINDEFIIFST